MSNLKLVCLGFQCRTCGYKFHHRCSNQVPALCQQVFYLVVFFYDITWLQGASHPSLFICEFLNFSTLLNRKQRFLVQSIFLKGIIFKIGYNYHYILIGDKNVSCSTVLWLNFSGLGERTLGCRIERVLGTGP